MTRNYEVRCSPVAAADGPGFQFYRDRYGPIIARCTHCRIGLTVTDENAGVVKWARALRSGDFIVTPDLGSPSHLKYFYDRPKSLHVVDITVLHGIITSTDIRLRLMPSDN